MSVRYFCRIADRIRGDCVLPLEINLPIGFVRQYHLTVGSGKKFSPERQLFVKIQAERQPNAEFRLRIRPNLLQQQLIFKFIEIESVFPQGQSGAPFALIARDQFPAVGKPYNRQIALAGTSLACSCRCSIGKVL